MSRKKKIILVLSSVIIALLVSAFLYVFYSYEKYSHFDNTPNSEEKNTDTSKGENEDIKASDDNVDFKEIEGITNILLIGTDARTLDESARSDSIMILTLDDIHKKIKLTSIMRDTYVKIPNYGEQKITHAFAYGGIDLLKKTIELNFKTKIDNFAIINFFGFKDLIDGIGGLEIDVKNGELKELNRCILLEIQDSVQLSSNDAHYVKKTGLQLLNGQQVLAYSRMRHVGNGCYDRSQRQRYVVNLIMNKLKDTSFVKYPSVANKLLPCVKTDLQFTQALDVAYTAYSIGNFDIEQLQVPANKLSYGRMYKDKGWVLLIDKAQNIDVMQKFIFEDIAYDDLKYSTFNYRQSEYYYYEPPVVEEDKDSDDEEKESDDKNEEIDSENNEDINEEDIDEEDIDEEDINEEDIDEEDINDGQGNDENGLSEDKNTDNNEEDNQEDENIDKDNITDEEENNNDNTLEQEDSNSNDNSLDDQDQKSDNENVDADNIKDNIDSSTEINNGIIDFDNEDFYKNEETNNETKESDKEINNDEVENGNKDNGNEVISEESQEKSDEELDVQTDKINSDTSDTNDAM